MQPQSPRPAPRPSGRYPEAKPVSRPADTRSRFTRAREQVQASTGPWASEETKLRWLTERSQLWLHRAEKKPGKFGDRWILQISEGAPTATICYLSLKANGWRDQLFEAIGADLTEDPTAIGPLALSQIEIEGSPNPAWDLVEWEETDGGRNF